MLNEDLIKKVVKEMIEEGVIKVGVDLSYYRIDSDDFGNSTGAIGDIDLDVYLEVEDEEEE
ncbi:hypothetical protein NVP1121O_234 [Vibrio phage 1.121.O._10N.286.46.C4]|nr:hypothetical protein NVP1121O_234 [Vibrio phage 1.121.O._10N.286.46.C4]